MSIWKSFTSKAKDIDAWRKLHLSVAEFIDAWRIIPRAVVILYGYGLWEMGQWYIELKPYILEGCNIEALKELCIVNAPTTEHMALVTAMIALAGAIFGLYANSGKKWNGFTHWNKTNGNPPPAPPEEQKGE